jgi:hypothetical protein
MAYRERKERERERDVEAIITVRRTLSNQWRNPNDRDSEAQWV